MVRAIATALLASVFLALSALALNLSALGTDALTIAAVPVIVLIGLGVKPTELHLRRHRSR